MNIRISKVLQNNNKVLNKFLKFYSIQMKIRHFKVKNQQSGFQSITHIKNKTQAQSYLSPSRSRAHQEYHNFSQFIDMFKSFLKSSSKSQKNDIDQYRDSIQPRDRQILLSLPEIVEGKIEEVNLKKWVTKIFKTVASSAFHYYSTKEMSFQQTKIYCSQNIFNNLAHLSKNYTLSAQQIESIDSHISGGVLNYLAFKYPLTENTEVNKKLEKIIHQTDNIQAVNNNYLLSSRVQFQYREDQNYNDFIMQLINEIMELLQTPSEKHLNYFQDFQNFMASLFQKVQDLQWMQSQNTLHQSQEKQLLNNNQRIDPKVHTVRQENDQEQQKKKILGKKYKESVKQYTHYLIGRKIPQNTQRYSEKEIESKNIHIKSPTILRILIKWCDQLWQKFEQTHYFSNRFENIKIQNNRKANVLLPWLRKEIDKLLQAEKDDIQKFMKQIHENNYQMQSKILERQSRSQLGGEHLDELEKISGKFSNKIVKNTHSYVILYLNKLIHSLMKVSKQIFEIFGLWKTPEWPTPPDLLTFKIGDIMRCKCSSKQKEIIGIYKQLQRLSKDTPEKLKIVRVKNRLKSGTNDILINFKFNNLILCEVQLAIKTESSNFIKCSNMFHHYLYELQRSNFGSLTELCSIWNTLDQRSKIYYELIQKQNKSFVNTEHICARLKKKFQVITITKPFICSECNMAFFHNNYLKLHKKCFNCQYFICSNCQIKHSSHQALKVQYLRGHQLEKSATRIITQKDPFPSLGLCILLQSKAPKVQFFQHFIAENNNKEYVIGRQASNKIYEISNIKAQKLKKDFKQKYLIFELKDDQDIQKITFDEFSLYILKEVMKLNFKKEKESISLIEANITTEECKALLNIGTQEQKNVVKTLFLSDNYFGFIPFQPLSFQNLQMLSLSRTNLTSFEGLQKLRNLKYLYLVSLGLQRIPQNILIISSLEQLYITSNKIKSIPPQIAYLKNLKKFYAETNEIETLPNEICECQKLEQLVLQGNILTQLPQAINKLINLKMLAFNQNKLKRIPEQIGDLKKLVLLNLDNNPELKTLPSRVTQLSSLQTLILSKTSLSCLPQNFHEMQKLTELDLTQAKIQKFPINLKQLKCLQNVYSSSVSSIVDFLPVLEVQSLRILNINNCNIRNLPEQVKNLQKLEILEISENNLTEIPSFILKDLNNLRKITAKTNLLNTFPNLNYLSKLTHIDLSQNKISEIKDQFLIGTTNIQVFSLNSNKVEQLPNIFKEFYRIQYLSLKDNQLKSLFSESFQEELNQLQYCIWPNLTDIILGANNLCKLPKFIFKCSKLINFQAESNRITQIPPELKNLKNLMVLSLGTNMVQTIPPQLQLLERIKNINLSSNPIRLVPRFIQNCKKLKFFWLNNCSIETIQCLDWIIQKKYTISFNSLAFTADKLKNQRKQEKEIKEQ